MIVHSASDESPAARGTTYSATRIGLDAGRRCQRGGSSHRRLAACGAAGDALELAAGCGAELEIELAAGADESSSGGLFEHWGRAASIAISPASWPNDTGLF
jgi:hypothetical protein